MKFNTTALRRPLAFVSALILAVIGILPALSFSTVSATSQVSGRSVTLSDSTANAQHVTYAMTITTLDPAQSLVLDFCSQSPIIGGTCTEPAGMSTTSALYSTSVTGSLPITGGAGSLVTSWTLDNTHDGSLRLTANTAGNEIAAGKYTFYFTELTNPSPTPPSPQTAPDGTNSFYARVYTFANNSLGTYSNAGAPGNYVDYGGFALSTANNITITAIVMETLGFCVSKNTITAACGSQVAPLTGGVPIVTPTLTLGHGTPKAIDTSAVDTDTAYTQLSTNALSGAVVALKTTSSTNCSGLSRNSGISCDIPANGNAGGKIIAGTAGFGLTVGAGTVATNSAYTGPGTVTPTTGSYNTNGGANNYYLGTSAPISTFGDPIEASTTACQDINNQLTYGATASATTPAGVYTTTEALIATGTF